MLVGQVAMIMISWIPHAVQRLYAVITIDVVKSPMRSAEDNLWEQITWIVSTLNNSLSFYVYFLTGGVLFRQTMSSLLAATKVQPRMIIHDHTNHIPQTTHT